MLKNTTIENMVRTLTIDGMAALDEEWVREDLIGLFMDIRAELQVKMPAKEAWIYEYAMLLQEELELHSPYAAFEAGALFGCYPQGTDKDKSRAFMRYLYRTECDLVSKGIHNRVYIAYTELCRLLGESRGLMDEFTELYRKCNGIIQDKLDVFFGMGYELTNCGAHGGDGGA